MKIIQEPVRGPFWVSPKLLVDDLKQLEAYFIKVLELSKTELKEARKEWPSLAMVVWNLGWWVSVESMVRKIRSKANLSYDP